MGYKFPSDVKDEEQELDDLVLKLLNGRTAENGAQFFKILPPDNEVYGALRCSFYNGKLSGIQYLYDPDGNLLSTIQYLNGVRHGVYVKHHINGRIATAGTYKHGNPIGAWRFYDLSGLLVNVQIFE